VASQQRLCTEGAGDREAVQAHGCVRETPGHRPHRHASGCEGMASTCQRQINLAAVLGHAVSAGFLNAQDQRRAVTNYA